VFNGPHPETGEELEVVEERPEGVPAHDVPAEIVARLREQAGLSKEPTGEVANRSGSSRSSSRAKRKRTAARRRTRLGRADNSNNAGRLRLVR
jgi:Mn-containing catalase